MAPVLCLTCLLSASVSLGSTFFVVQKGPCLAPRLLFFLITYPGIEVTSRLFWSYSVGLREYFIFLPQLQQIIPISQLSITIKTLLFGRIFVKFEDLSVVHVGDQILRLFAELVDLLRLAQVLKASPEGMILLVCGSRPSRSTS